MSNLTQKVATSQKFGYLCGGISYSFCMMIPAFLMYYATENLGIAIGAMGAMVALVKIFDGFTDFIAGIIIDKTHAKSGKARPWFLRVAIPYAICIVLMFSIPTGLGSSAKFALLTIFYALTVSVFGTIIGVARYAIVPRMTSDLKEQGALGVLGDGIGVIFMGAGLGITFIMVEKIGWSGIFSIYGLIALVSTLLCYAFTREQTEEISKALDGKRVKESNAVKNFISAIFGNKYTLLLFIIVFLQQMSGGFISGAGPYYYSYIIGDTNLSNFSFAMGLCVVTFVIGLVTCSFIIRKIGPKKMFVTGGILTIVCYVVILIAGPENLMLMNITLALCMMFAMTFLAGNFAAFASCAVMYGIKKNGIRKEGIISSVINLGIKLGTAFSAMLMGAVMGLGGFVEGGVEQTAEALRSIQIVFYVIPILGFLAVTLIVAFVFRFDKDMEKLDIAS